jgi:hypothetical protein
VRGVCYFSDTTRVAQGYTPTTFAAALLGRLGIPVSRGAVRSVVGWERAEGGNWNNTAHFNPLNTTQAAPGAGSTGTQGNIKSYTNWNQGLNATAQTLRNGHYGGILQALKTGNPDAVANAIGSSPWGTSSDLIHRVIAGTHVGNVSGLQNLAAPSTGGRHQGLISPGSGSDSGAGAQSPAPSLTDPGQASDFTGLLSNMLQHSQPQVQSSPIAPPSFAAGPKLAQGLQPLDAQVPQKAGSAAPGVADLLSSISGSGGSSPQLPGVQPAGNDQNAAGAGGKATISPEGRTHGTNGAGGASAALTWARSKLGFHETGTNSGGLASRLNKQFGFSAAPWCAMFTSAAITRGGAPESARSASVATIRSKAQQGVGYERGFINPHQAQSGDLILFGNDHIAMVDHIAHGRVFYVGGNQSDAVSEHNVPLGTGDIVRPKYGARG